VTDRFVVAGLARARTPWFAQVGRWATEGAVPLEYVRCTSAAELRSRLESGRAWSAVLLADDVPGVDRDLFEAVREAGAAPLVVTSGPTQDWITLGAGALLPVGFDREGLLEALQAAAAPVDDSVARHSHTGDVPAPARRGRLVAVTGPGGTGVSTAAIALAEGLAASRGPGVLLADLRRAAEQALLHDARRVEPGLQELVEAHRGVAPDAGQVRALTFDVPARGYRLLLGLRRPQQWPVLRPNALGAALDGLQHAFDVVVADVDPDVDGEQETGARAVEDRHLAARLTLGRADAVLVVGLPGLKGTYALTRLVGELLAFGVPPARLVTVVNRAPRRRAQRAELTRTVAELLATTLAGAALPSPVFLPERRVEEALHDGIGLPSPLPGDLAAVVGRLLTGPRAALPTTHATPVAVVPGQLGLEGGVGA
jgi:hypothetical protein